MQSCLEQPKNLTEVEALNFFIRLSYADNSAGPIFIVPVGLPGMGKSTFANKLKRTIIQNQQLSTL